MTKSTTKSKQNDVDAKAKSGEVNRNQTVEGEGSYTAKIESMRGSTAMRLLCVSMRVFQVSFYRLLNLFGCCCLLGFLLPLILNYEMMMQQVRTGELPTRWRAQGLGRDPHALAWTTLSFSISNWRADAAAGVFRPGRWH